jgi:3-deoxy-7-phosphoheptulonate synthase
MMWIQLTEGADVGAIQGELRGLGLWTRPMASSTGEAVGLSVEPHSCRVSPKRILAIAGVADVRVHPSAHPRVDAQANQAVQVGTIHIGAGCAPVLMAGPCSVETETQIHEAAHFAAQAGARLLRGGAFKPRTSPYSFDGLGVSALRWLRAAATAHGLGVVTEVMSEQDVETVAPFADLIQVGSRNMQNFALLRVVGQLGSPVLLKRGMAASVEEWLLAGEHLLHAGSSGVIFCERGIQSFDPSTRYLLDLAAVALLKQVYQQPVIVDPSHGVGRRDLVATMGRAALTAGADGLIVEMHPEPEVAQSDGPQALSPQELMALGKHMGVSPWARNREARV